jgi:hypothetical protein
MSIRKKIEMKKKAEKEALEKMDPTIQQNEDTLDLELEDWDYKFSGTL